MKKMHSFSRKSFLYSLLISVLIFSCKKNDTEAPAPPKGPYETGIILVNEGWFGHDNGNVNFYHYGSDTITQMVYAKENTGKELGVTTQFGAVYNEKLYLISKQGPLVVTDANTLIETGRIETLPADGRAFVGIDNNLGLVSTADGVYKLNLNTLVIGDKIPNVTGETGTMTVEGNYIFVSNQTAGVIVLNKSDYSVAMEIPAVKTGVVKTKNGHLWTLGGKLLIDINPSTLDTTKIELPFVVGDPWFAWNIGTLTASTKENAVFIGRTESWGAGGNEIYKYVSGNPASVNAPFATLPAGKEFYGAAVQYNPIKDEVVVTAVQSGYGENYSYNSLYIYDPANAALKKTVNYTYYYFPAMMIFK
jgi:hypothetical protein